MPSNAQVLFEKARAAGIKLIAQEAEIRDLTHEKNLQYRVEIIEALIASVEALDCEGTWPDVDRVKLTELMKKKLLPLQRLGLYDDMQQMLLEHLRSCRVL